MAPQLTILKLGGALLTNKGTPNALRDITLGHCAEEIAAAGEQGLIQRLILVHGVGSFGHPPVIAHELHRGYQGPEQLLPLSATQSNVMRLRLAIAEALEAAGVPACLMLPSSCMSGAGDSPRTRYFDAIAGFLDLGMVPLLGGDIVPDPEHGFRVYSGDVLAVELALHFQAQQLYFASTVDGVYERDPAEDPGARKVRRYRLMGDSVDLDEHAAVDASGAMAGKLRALLPARDAMAGGLEVRIFSMRQEGRLLRLLEGAPGIGTEILA